MKRIHFNLQNPNSEVSTFIYVNLLPDVGGRVRLSTKQKVFSAHWKNNRCVAPKGNKVLEEDYFFANIILERLEQAVSKLMLESKLRSIPISKRAVLEIMCPVIGKVITPTNQRGFISVFNEYIESRRSGKVVQRKTKKRYSNVRIENLVSFKNVILQFIDWLGRSRENVNKRKLNLDEFDQEMMNLFIEFCQKHKNYCTNTIGTKTSILKTFFKDTYKANHYNACFTEDWFVKCEEHPIDIFLDDQEIEQLYEVRIPKFLQNREVVRDWFIIDCYTGLRISDLLPLTQEHITGDTISLYNRKTGTEVAIPLHQKVKAILTKYRGFPPRVSDVTMNKHIKQVAHLAGIVNPVLHKITRGGHLVESRIAKNEMISNHTARRSFITNLMLSGQFTDQQVMGLVGLKKHATLLKYYKATPQQVANNIKNHPYWKGKYNLVGE